MLWPKRSHRGSPIECSGSGIVIDSGSPKVVAASSKATPCLRRFAAALSRSQTKRSIGRM